MSVIPNSSSIPKRVPIRVGKTATRVISQLSQTSAERELEAELCDADSAAKHASSWQALANDPLERNVFYEPWMLLPAMRAFAGRKDVRVLFVFRNADKAEVVGIFPLEYHHFRFSPVTVVSLWRHPHCFLCTPLLNRDFAAQAMAVAVDKIMAEPSGRTLIAFRTISGDGPFHSLLMKEATRRQLLSVEETHSRPIARTLPNTEEFLRTDMSGKRRRGMLRRERKLAALGELESQTEVRDLDRWIESFLGMESAGWKGRQGTSLNANHEAREFFRTTVREAHRRNQLMPISLVLNGQPLAHRLSFISGDEAFAFKSTYDESYSAYSPGVLLELATLRDLHSRTDLHMMDSCTASPDHAPMNGMWRECRAIHTVFVMPATTIGRLLQWGLPSLRALEKRIAASKQKFATYKGGTLRVVSLAHKS